MAESSELMERLAGRLSRQFGQLAEPIMETLVDVLGDLRLTFPNREDLRRMTRNRMICAEWRGNNVGELSMRYHKSRSQIRRIVNAQKGGQSL